MQIKKFTVMYVYLLLVWHDRLRCVLNLEFWESPLAIRLYNDIQYLLSYHFVITQYWGMVR